MVLKVVQPVTAAAAAGLIEFVVSHVIPDTSTFYDCHRPVIATNQAWHTAMLSLVSNMVAWNVPYGPRGTQVAYSVGTYLAARLASGYASKKQIESSPDSAYYGTGLYGSMSITVMKCEAEPNVKDYIYHAIIAAVSSSLALAV
jgi:hypothetical protein